VGIKVELKKEDGKIISVSVGGEGFIDKKRFKELLSVIKTLDEREFDSYRKVWVAPLTRDNVKKLELILSNAEIEALKKEL